MERTEYPTQLHIESLKEKGVIPYSPFSVRLCVAVGAVASTANALRELYTLGVKVDVYSLVTDTASVAFLSIISALVAGLVQTRFQSSPNRLSLSSSSEGAGIFVLGLLCSTLVGYFSSTSLGSFLFLDPKQGIAELTEISWQGLYVGCIFLFVAAAVLILWSRITFPLFNRMTHDEKRAEHR